MENPRDFQILGIIIHVGSLGSRRTWDVCGTGVAGLVGAGVIDIGGLGIAEGGKAAVLAAGGRIALAAFLAGRPGRAGTSGGRLRTGRDLVEAEHVRAGVDQLAVGGERDAALGRIVGESGVGGNQAIGHERPAAGCPDRRRTSFRGYFGRPCGKWSGWAGHLHENRAPGGRSGRARDGEVRSPGSPNPSCGSGPGTWPGPG